MALLDKFRNKSYDDIPTSTGGGPVNRFFNLENPRSDAIQADTVAGQSELEAGVGKAKGMVQGMQLDNIEVSRQMAKNKVEMQGINERSKNWAIKPRQPGAPTAAVTPSPAASGMALPAPAPNPMAAMRPPTPMNNTNIGMSGAMPGMTQKRSAIATVTSPAATAATASLAKPMAQIRGEAYGGPGFQGPMPSKTPESPVTEGFLPPPVMAGQKTPAPAKFGEARPLLGNTVFKNLQPRAPAGGSAKMSGNPMDSGAETQQSYAGFAPYLDEQTAGAPRRVSGFSGKRPGARFTEGPMRGKTLDQATLKARSQYAALSPEQKAAYESKARMEDISSEVPATGVAPASQLKPLAPTPLPPMGIDPAELDTIAPPRRRPTMPLMGRPKPAEDWPD